jgi:hypothetical protein
MRSSLKAVWRPTPRVELVPIPPIATEQRHDDHELS